MKTSELFNKNYFLILVAYIFLSPFSFSQACITGGTISQHNVPMDPNYEYSYTQSIYLASEINSPSGNITALSFYFIPTLDMINSDDDIQIYLGNTTKTEFTGTSDWVALASLTQVFNGSMGPFEEGWVTVTLDTPFSYNGTDNLIVAMDANEPGFDSSSNRFLAMDAANQRSIYYRSDSTNPDPAAPPTATSTSSNIPNIIFEGLAQPIECSNNNYPSNGAIDIVLSCDSEVTLTWDYGGCSVDNFNIYYGTTSGELELVGNTPDMQFDLSGVSPSTTYFYKVIPKNGINDEAIGCAELSFTTGANSSNGGSGGGSTVYYYGNNYYNEGTPARDYDYLDPVAAGHTEITTWTSGDDDDGYFQAALPFTFQYYDVDYTEVFIGTNGYASFASGYNTTGNNTTLGSTTDPDNMIAVAMMDLDDRGDGQIFYGVNPAGDFVITWYHYHDFQDDDEWMTIQLILRANPVITENGFFEIRFNEAESSMNIDDFLADAVIGCEDIDANASTNFASYREDGSGGSLTCSPLVLAFAPTEAEVALLADNDKCAGATALIVYDGACGSTVTGTNIGATDSGVAHACSGGNYQGGDVWFSFVAPSTGSVTIETSAAAENSITDTVFEVYDDCGTLVSQGCDDQGGAGNFSKLELSGLVSAQTYYIAVWEWQNDDFGNFDICLWDHSTCDDFVATTSEDLSNCPTNSFDITLDVTDIGQASTVNISHNGSSPDNENGVGVGMYTFTGFTGEGPITFTINDSALPLCSTEIVSQNLNCPPINDDCTFATPLTVSNSSCANTLTGTNIEASDSGIAHACSGSNYQGGDVWFSFVAPSSGSVTIETSAAAENSIIDTALEVYDGCGTLVSQGCDDEGGAGSFSKLELNGLVSAQTYYIAVWEWGNNVFGNFDICAYDHSTCATPPAGTSIATNINCTTNTFDITVDVTNLGPGTTVDITHNGSGTTQTGVGIGMYTLTGFATEDMKVIVNIANSADALCFVELPGVYNACAPTNDDCATPLVVTPSQNLECNNPIAATIIGATQSTEAESCTDGGTFNDDVWFEFTASAPVHEIQIENITGTVSDLIFQLSEGSCGSLTELFCFDEPDSGFTTPSLIVGNDYLLRIASFSASPQDIIFDLCIGTPPPANDACENAIEVMVGSGACGLVTLVSNYAATNTVIGGCKNSEELEVWHSFVAPASGAVVIETVADGSGTITDPELGIYESCNDDIPLECDDDGGNNTFSRIEADELTPGQTYYIANWDLNFPTYGSFYLCVWEPECAPSKAEVFANNCSASGTDITVDLNYLGTADLVNITFTGSSATPPPTGVGIGSYSLDGFDIADNPVTITITDADDAECFVEYVVDFDPCPLINDDCINATPLPMGNMSCQTTIAGTNISATDSGIPHASCPIYGGGNDVWFSFVAPTSGEVTVQTSNLMGIDDVVAVYSACDGLTDVGCGDSLSGENIVMTGLTTGQTYYVAVYSYDTSPEGTFDICAFDPVGASGPANDDCANAVVMQINPTIVCGSFQYSGTTDGATASASPPLLCDPGGWDDDVWYTFTTSTDITIFQMVDDGMSTSSEANVHFYFTSDCGVLVENSCNQTTSGGLVVGFDPPIGTEIYVRISTVGSNPSDIYSFDLCVSEYCFETANLTGSNDGSLTNNDIESIGTITSTQIIESSAIVDYDSGTDIELNAGFEVKAGATFEAFIDGCNNGDGGSNIIDDVPVEKRLLDLEKKGYVILDFRKE